MRATANVKWDDGPEFTARFRVTAELHDVDAGQSWGRYGDCSLPSGGELREIEDVRLVGYCGADGETLGDLTPDAIKGLEAAFRAEIERDGANRASVEERLFEGAGERCFTDE